MKNLLRLAASFGLVLLSTRAQDQATTLCAASQRARAIVRATVVVATDPSPLWHRMLFRTDEVLKGPMPDEFSLLEPAGACCGRSLFALRVGDACLLLLEQRGPALHPFGGSRGVLADNPVVVSHLQALLQAQNDSQRAALLAASLDDPEPRIANDAAAALAVLPQLALSSAGRTALVLALQSAVQQGTTRTAPLLDAIVRLHDANMLDAVLPTYLTATSADQARLLRQGLSRCAAPLVVDGLLPHVFGSEHTAVRAAQLLGTLPSADARIGLQLMWAHTSNPRVQLWLAEGLLAAGASGALRTQMAASVPEPVLRLALRRHDQAKPFRSIDPRRQ
ncbi:MAG: hypothetical protein ABIP94_00820 [Planctomycetota bacterium]